MINTIFDEEIQRAIAQPAKQEALRGEELLKFIAQPVPPEPNELLMAIEREIRRNPESRALLLAMLKKHGI